MGKKWSLRFRIFLFFAMIAAGGVAAIAVGQILGFRRLGDAAAISPFIIAGAVGAFILIGLVAWIWLLFDENLVKPMERLSSDLRARAHADVEEDIDHRPARYLGDLAPAAAAVASNLTEMRSALAEAVARETARIAEENTRLEALLRDVPAGVVLCTATHRVVLYNTQATVLLADDAHLGLDRSLFDLLREGPLRHAYDRLRGPNAGERAVDLLCTTNQGTRVLQSRMRLVSDHSAGTGSAGYMLTLRDVTDELNAGADRDRLLRDTLERIRRPAANLQTTLEVLQASPDLDAGRRGRLQSVLAEETQSLVSWITDLGRRYDATAPGWWPMADVPAMDILDSLVARLEAEDQAVSVQADPLVLRCDGYALVQLLGSLMGSLLETGASDFRVSIEEEGPGALIALTWQGDVLPVENLEHWLAEPLMGGYGQYSGQDALVSLGTEIWPEPLQDGRARLCLPIRRARPETEMTPPRPRAEFYDFGLLDANASSVADDRDLTDLRYVVFDTETTGLLPHRGDEIVQIAAVRVVNRRILSGETFETLVNPLRPIPASSTRIHGITEEMVKEAPHFPPVAARFHRYCADSVMVAHNAPFDMAFFRRDEDHTGVRFDQPVLDTVLLSAILFGTTAEHSLDALAARLGIEIAEAERHTALGDAHATAKAFLKMIPMLRERGFVTLGQTISEFRKHARLLESLN